MNKIARYTVLLLSFFVADAITLHGQEMAPHKRAGHTAPPPDVRWIKHQVLNLASPAKSGRGYVRHGVENAAKYVAGQFKEIGLLPYPPDSGSYFQTYSFPVNTFPDRMDLKINKQELVPGADYIIDAGSPSYYTEKKKVKRINLDKVEDTTDWNEMKATFANEDRIYYLQYADSMCKRLSKSIWHLSAELPRGCYIIPQHGKITWTVATDTIQATVFYAEDTVLPKKAKYAAVNVHAKYIESYRNENVIACVPGDIKDSFIVYTAHFDHLGMMGAHAVFPGASDNASGTALMLYLAQYFRSHPQHYTMVFIGFSGEEAGLLGSKYFTEHPLFQLDHIRFLTNLDIMGDATDGITVVNAMEFTKEFDLLQQINGNKQYLPAIKSRGKTANSDHYFFTKAGVPSFFMYSNSGKGYYHDVFDKPNDLSLKNIDGVASLLIDFTAQVVKTR